MSFWQRFRYYLIGVTIGLVVSFYFFRGRGCGWLPENRVKNELVSSIIYYDAGIQCDLEKNNLSEEDIFNLLYDGDVLFSESKPNETPKVYVLQGKNKAGNDYKITFAIKDSVSRILNINGENKCKNLADSILEVKLPESIAKRLLSSQPLELNDLAACQKDCYDLSEEKIEKMLEKASFIQEASDRRKRPHPQLFFAKDGFEFVIEITPDVSRIINIINLSRPDCDCY